MPPISIFVLLYALVFLRRFSLAVDTITLSQSIRGNGTIVSAKERFELGFFSPGDSKNIYLGIWYKKIQPQTVVWVANRNNPITDSSAIFRISSNGNLELVNEAASVIWSTNITEVRNPIAQLMDTGNLVLQEEGNFDPKNYLWKSFDHPTDTLLPGMKLGWDSKSGLDRILTSWNSASDPSTGDYSVRLDRNGLPQGFIYKKLIPQARTGSWNGEEFTGVPQINQSFIFDFSYTSNQDELYYSYSLKNDSMSSRLVLSHSGQLQRRTWIEKDHLWNLFWYFPKNQCDNYNGCGANAICTIEDSQNCECLNGFQPKDQQDWYLRDRSGGCIQTTKYVCQKNDGFLQLKEMKIPDTSWSFVDTSMDLKECEAECRKNCSCKAYTNANVTNGGSGCVIWFNDLLDLRVYSVGGQDLYVRVADSLLGNGKKKDAKHDSERKKHVLLLTLTVIPMVGLLMVGICVASRKKIIRSMQIKAISERVFKQKSQELPLFHGVISSNRDYSGDSKDEVDLPSFDLCTMATATSNFSDVNKLGEGGFGSVYKGELKDGQQIAVKRLSKNSTQGVEEFKNEVVLIARLQHRNLVRLLGCCLEGEEKILVYEFMENKSLDSILFDKTNNLSLDWQKRFNIVLGIARGLLYLHQDSIFRIIHRDLKASNVLLDAEMNPKISDFGMARIFGGDQTEANTRRVVGTYGYMSPEYAMDGLFSIKSDVFSFGVLVLEIVSGTKNRGFYSSFEQPNLLGQAWKLWREGKGLELTDQSMGDPCLPSEVLRCIQVGLLCVQEHAEDRPNMASVLLMLSSDTTTMPLPKQPGFCFLSGPLETEAPCIKQEPHNSNQVTLTMLQAR